MAEQPERVIYGTRIMMHALGVSRCVIGIERNKPDAIAALTAVLPTDIDITIQPLTVKYPQGAEKMLIKAVTGREVPSGKLPLHVGVIVQNVGTVATIGEVFETGLPLVERVVTITGPGVKQPGNLLIPVGTKVRDALAYCGGLTDDVSELIFGGPMMGFAQSDLDTPITKGVTGVIALTPAVAHSAPTLPCIKCGRCLDACPVFLNPSTLGALAQVGRFQDMEALHLADCMLCGSCSYVCPSSIPLAQMFALSKAGLRKQKAKATVASSEPAKVAATAGAA
jgi:electron transport complex protein RnfC